MIKLLEYEDILPPLSSTDNSEHERIRNDRKSGLLVACVVIEWLRVVALFTSTILAGIGFYNLGKSAQQGSLQIGLFVGIFISFTVATIVLFTSKRKIIFLPTLIGLLVISIWLHTEGVLSVSIEWSMAFPVFLLVILSLLGVSGFVFSALFFNKFYDFDIVEGDFKTRLKDRMSKGFLTFIKPETLIFCFFMVATSIAIIALDGHSFTANLLAFFHTEHQDKNLDDDAIYKSLNAQLQKLESNIENDKITLRNEKKGVYEGLKRQNQLNINSLYGKRAVRQEDKNRIQNGILSYKRQIQSDSITSITEIANGEKAINAKYEKQLSKLRNDILERTNQINDGNISGQQKSEDNKAKIEMAGYGLAQFNEPLFIFLTMVSLHFRRKLAYRLVSKMKLNQGSIIGRMFYTLKIAFQQHLHTFIQEWDSILLDDATAQKLQSVKIAALDIDIEDSTPSVSAEPTIKVWSKDDVEKYFRSKLLKVFERGYKPLDGIAEHKKATRLQSNKNNQSRFNNLLQEMEDNTGWTVVIDDSETELSQTDNGENWQRPVFHLKVKQLAAIA